MLLNALGRGVQSQPWLYTSVSELVVWLLHAAAQAVFVGDHMAGGN